MSDEKPKPFADARDGRLVIGEVTVNYDFGESARIGRERFPELAAIVNAAVESREAKLRAIAQKMLDAYDYVDFDGITALCGFCDVNLAYHSDSDCAAQRIATEARAVLAGTGPDYVPRAELDAVNAKLKAYGAAVDLLDAREGLTRAEVCAWLETAGLKRPPRPEDWTDEEVTWRLEAAKAEVKRRMAIEHVFRSYEYGHRDGRTSLTGASYCGKALDYGGHWNAVTIDTFMRDGAQADTCAGCIAHLDAEMARSA